ncbi:MAG: hypothetical protein DMG16_30270 [Acidobacteria bacterium]|nr:MAG: hypothetical protein DMG16_30270 [Acidobacteriota bacterium]
MATAIRNTLLSFVLITIACVSLAQVSPKKGFLYQPSLGSFWDPTVIYANNRYYMYTMYGGDGVWLATSDDGVHWKDFGVVLKSQGFKNNRVWKQYIHKVGDRYILNHGAFTDQATNNNLLRFYESKDLIHWTYLYEVPIDPNFYRSDGRWDHMYVVPKNDARLSDGYWGYVVADPIDHGGFGMMESADGIHFKPVKAPEMISDFRIPTLEIGGIKKLGNKYYLLGGNVNHFGFYGYGVYTYVADSLTGPFRPDMDAYRLTGTSGIDGNYYIHVLACFVKDSPEDLVSDPFTFRSSSGTDGQGTWFLPMRKAVVDAQGHLRLGYWKQNDLAKGSEVLADASQNVVTFPPGQTESNPIVRVAATKDSVTVHTDKSWRGIPWLESDKTRKAVVVLNQRFDLDQGVIVEGQIRANTLTKPWNDARKTYAGFYIEGSEKNTGTAVMLELGEPQWRETKIGRVRTDTSFNFETVDVTGRNSATVTGLDNGKDHSFRLWLRGGQMELYIDDMLMQSFFYYKATGRIGFISQENEAHFSQLKFYRMNL